MAENFDSFKDLYEVKRTIRFELKPVHFRGEKHEDNINFEKSKQFMEEEFLKYGTEAKTKEERNSNLRKNLQTIFSFTDKIYSDFSFFLKQLQKKNIPFSGLEITASLLENFNPEEYHRHKKGTNKTKFVELQTIPGDHFLEWFFNGFRNQIDEIRKFEVKIKDHQLWTQSDYQQMENATRWYADIDSFARKLETFESILSYIKFPKRLNEKKDYQYSENQKENWEKSREKLRDFFNKQKSKERILIYRCLIDGVKENAFIECGMISMNEKALNKNPLKIEQMKLWLENLIGNDEKKIIGEQDRKLQEIRILDDKRKITLDGDKMSNKKGLYELIDEESKKWVKNGIDKCPEFAIHLLQTPKYNQELNDIKNERVSKMKEIKARREQVGNEDRNIYNLQSEIDNLSTKYYRLKIEKGLIQDRKRLFIERGILSFKCIKNVEQVYNELKKQNNPSKRAQLLNFQYVWEQKKDKNENQNYSNLTYLQSSEELKKLHQENINLINRKRDLSQQYGNNKNLINSLQREIERQGKINYQGVLVRDKEFYYLAFLDRENRKNLWQHSFIEKEKSDFKVLEYERLTFKALEKLALIENATFENIESVTKNELVELRKEYAEQKEKQWKKYEKEREKNFDKSLKKITKDDLPDNKLEEATQVKIINILKEVLGKLDYQEFLKKISNKHYINLEEFSRIINQECYKINWIDIDQNAFIDAENNNKIALFKIHNKDFSRAKRRFNNRKNNIFTEYWLDIFENGNSNIRILPEIDLFKKRKEKNIEEVDKIITKRKNINIDVEGNRFCENKFYAAFRIQFYPEKISPTVEGLSDKINKNYLTPKYFLGLDRGENELLTYCLIDEQGKVVIDKESHEPIIGDWNMDIDFGVDGTVLPNYERKQSYADMLKKFTQERKELSEQSILLQNSDDETEKERIYRRLEEIRDLEAENVKNGFCAHVLEQINNITKKYKSVYIVMEDLDIEKSVENAKSTNKEDTYEKLLGSSAYQQIEDAIISKFKYYQTKNNQFHGTQFVPNIERIRDLRIVENESNLERNKFGRIKYLKSKDQIGNILFVDEFLSSQMCPECGFCICDESEKARAMKYGNPITYEHVKNCKIDIVDEDNFKKVYINNEVFVIKHFLEVKEKKQKDFIELDITTIENILKPRIKSQRICKDYFAEKDPLFCPKCKKNTEEKNFIEPLESGDDIASYNIAKRGLLYINNLNK